ncbi:hypothetical protein BC831DRAFT_476196 [Entophlyctis helioformis]|nr:hypothetical protein BC831DRAFT_476196 [Entophlyctis helioformis]
MLRIGGMASNNGDSSSDELDLFADPTQEELAINAQRRADSLAAQQAARSAPAHTTEQRRRAYLMSGPAKRNKLHWLPHVWSADECARIALAVNSHTAPVAASTSASHGHGRAGGRDPSGWTTDRHDSFPTTDVPVADLQPDLAAFIVSSLTDRVLGPAAAATGFLPSDLVFLDLFIVLYDADHGGQRSLDEHTDGCLLSFNVLINAPSDFTGGGTFFSSLPSSGAAAMPETQMPETQTPAMPVPMGYLAMLGQGDCVVHDSKLPHAGREVTRGRRMICVGFVESRRSAAAAAASGKRPVADLLRPTAPRP